MNNVGNVCHFLIYEWLIIQTNVKYLFFEGVEKSTLYTGKQSSVTVVMVKVTPYYSDCYGNFFYYCSPKPPEKKKNEIVINVVIFYIH